MSSKRRRNSKGEFLAFDGEDDTQFEERRCGLHRPPTTKPKQQQRQRRRNSKGEALAFDAASLQHDTAAGADEQQFEEARATHCADRMPVFCSASLSLAAPPPPAATPATAKKTATDAHKKVATAVARSGVTTAATPTVHTKLAMDELLSMFNEPLGDGDGGGGGAAADPVTPGPTPGRPQLLAASDLVGGGGGIEIFDEGIGEAAATAPQSRRPFAMSTASRCSRVSTMPTPSASVINMSRTTKALLEVLDEDMMEEATTPSAAAAAAVIDPFGEAHNSLVRQRLSALRDCDGTMHLHQGANAPAVLTAPSSAALAERGAVVELAEAFKYDLDAGGPAAEGESSRVFRGIRVGDTSDLPCCPLALKVSMPPAHGEWLIAQVIKARVAPERQRFFLVHSEAHFYDNASVLVSPFHHSGTLMRAIHAHQRAGRRMEEPLCMYYTIEILRIVSILHSEARVIHADIKPDNLLVMSSSSSSGGGSDDASATWGDWTQTCSRGGWEGRGLVLLDFGHAIDRSMYPPGTLFSGRCHSETFTCADMRAGMPWGFQVDTHGIAVTVHCMLFGSWLQAVPQAAPATPGGSTRVRWRPKEEFKKYWMHQLWAELFDTLLNADEDVSLDALRGKFENALKDPRRAREVRMLLSRQDVLLAEYTEEATE